jgi:hypothetical protein
MVALDDQTIAIASERQLWINRQRRRLSHSTQRMRRPTSTLGARGSITLKHKRLRE